MLLKCFSTHAKKIHSQCYSCTHRKSRSSPPPPVHSNTRPFVSACEAYFYPGPISTSTLSSGHCTIKMDGVELSHRNLDMLFSFPSISQLVSLTLHVSCLRNSPSVVEACCWEKERKVKFGACLGLGSACVLIYPSHSLGCCNGEKEAREGKRQRLVLWYQTAGGEGLMA